MFTEVTCSFPSPPFRVKDVLPSVRKLLGAAPQPCLCRTWWIPIPRPPRPWEQLEDCDQFPVMRKVREKDSDIGRKMGEYYCKIVGANIMNIVVNMIVNLI